MTEHQIFSIKYSKATKIINTFSNSEILPFVMREQNTSRNTFLGTLQLKITISYTKLSYNIYIYINK